MAWFSILPEGWSSLETGLIRLFVCIGLGLLMIGPWAIVLVYDIVLYIWRSISYEVPFVGGRARGKQRPRAPSLTERPTGEPRNIGVIRPLSRSGEEDAATGNGAYKNDNESPTPRQRNRNVSEPG
ncbi:hypothetical protein K402DRAFT_343762 [Aulographum hederae CBS 113979]|uniref:Uncharacterized protein n=1 Tax=Aulographum hederae CBS 113979 TaxID=1176131 RepID=A0A6G1GIU2_9PEZI|nr:hypothetical protein K402DRAFT_343762 [Aulographum hederae CBS 113979]